MPGDAYEDIHFFGDPPDLDTDAKGRPRGPIKAVIACNESGRAFAKEMEKWPVGQEVTTLALALRKHYLRIRSCMRPGSQFAKSIILPTGDTGTGESRLRSLLLRLLPVPYLYVDTTGVTEPGWAGASTDELVASFVATCRPSVTALIPYSIAVLDEINKKRVRAMGGSGKGVSGLGGQQSLLAWLDTETITYAVSIPGRRNFQGIDVS